MKKYSSTTRANSRHSIVRKWQRGLIVTALVLLCGWLFPPLVSSISFVVLYPVTVVSSWYQYSEGAFPSYLRSRAELTKEIDELKATIANDTGTELSVKRLLEENMQLRSAAEVSTSTNRISARVIAQPSKLSYDLLQIDQGSDTGIVVGAPVFLGFDTVIGVVVHVARTYAFVELVTTPGFIATAYIVGPNVFANLEGIGGGVARVRVPQGIALREGNPILLPSVSSGVYGEVVRIENVPTQPEQFGYVTPPLSLQSILYVSVAKDVPSEKSELEIETSVRASVQSYFKLNTIPDSMEFASTTNSASPETGTTSSSTATSTN
jgi:cell shape-determining protein MreC